MNLTDNEKRLFNLLIEYAGELMGNRICNDLTDEMRDCLSREEWDSLKKYFHEKNGDPEEYYPGGYLNDHSALWILSKKLGL